MADRYKSSLFDEDDICVKRATTNDLDKALRGTEGAVWGGMYGAVRGRVEDCDSSGVCTIVEEWET